MKKSIIIISILAFFLVNCKDKRGPWIITPTNRALIQPLIKGKSMDDSELVDIKAFILDKNNVKTYDPGYDDSTYIFLASKNYDGELKDKGILLLKASYLNFDKSIGPEHGIGACYLEFPDGSVDTIKIEGERVSDEEGAKDRCRCSFPIRNVWVNGKLCNISEEYSTQHGVYYYEH